METKPLPTDDGRYPHDADCDCDTCRMERARDTSEEYAHD